MQAAGQSAFELSERVEAARDRIAIGTMHLAKGLEFKAVAVMDELKAFFGQEDKCVVRRGIS